MGTPRYPNDISKQMRDAANGTRDVFTMAASNQRQTRPWLSAGISDSATTFWPSTTSATFTDMQRATFVRTHESWGFWARVSAPAAGSEFRIVSSSGTVLFGPMSCASGVNEIQGIITLPGPEDYYADFFVKTQVRSITAGQTTLTTIASFYGREL